MSATFAVRGASGRFAAGCDGSAAGFAAAFAAMSMEPVKRQPSSSTTRAAEMLPCTLPARLTVTSSSAARSPCTVPSTVIFLALMFALTWPSSPSRTSFLGKVTVPSMRPRMIRSSLPVTSPRMVIEGPMVPSSAADGARGVRDIGIADSGLASGTDALGGRVGSSLSDFFHILSSSTRFARGKWGHFSGRLQQLTFDNSASLHSFN